MTINDTNDILEEIENTVQYNNSNIIKNISFDQKEILYNIMQLYTDGQPYDCDITASTLKFYEQKKSDKYVIPEPQLLFDVYPQYDKVKPITPFKPIPLEDNSIKSVVVDLPFVISPKTCKSMKEGKSSSNMIANRFSSWYPAMEGYTNMYWWMKECSRILSDGGIIVWKMQDTISGGLYHSFIEFCTLCAQSFGLYLVDQFQLLAKARLIPSTKIKKQQHARKYNSAFLVLKKDIKAADKVSPINILQYCKDNVKENMQWELK